MLSKCDDLRILSIIPVENYADNKLSKYETAHTGGSLWPHIALRQAPGESVQNFCERIFAIAAEAYKGQDLANTVIQQILVDTLISGVTSDILCKHLIKNKPKTLDKALSLSLKEQTDAKSFELRRRHEEPMDVSAVNRVVVPVEKRLDKIEDNLASLCTQLQNVMTVRARAPMNQNTTLPMAPNPRTRAEWTGGPVGQSRFSGPPQAPQTRYEWTEDGRPICNFCRNVGHTENKCRKKRFERTPKN